jgi:hypothetical protein
MLDIQFIGTRALRSQSEAWETHHSLRGVDYTDYASVERAVAALELDADGAWQYRIVEVASIEDSYLELRAENEDALEAMAGWVAAGCPRTGESIEDLRRAANACVNAAPVKVVKKEEAA